MTNQPLYDEEYAARQVRRHRNPLRRLIKGFYLRNMLREVRGRTIDLGFGAGQLLERLAPGSLGLEVSPHLIEHARTAGLNAALYYATAGSSTSSRSTPIRHSFWHTWQSTSTTRRPSSIASCDPAHASASRVIFVVPGARGFRFDRTHRTFVNRSYLEEHGLLACEGYSVSVIR